MFVWLGCLSLAAAAQEQQPWRHLVSRTHTPDSLDVARLNHKAFWRAGAETVGFNIGLWAFDRYVQKGHYAYISWSTIKENFRHGFEWDNDHLSTNMFAHPYNGSLFFNAGRSNGFNFWQSELFAIGGSAMWEMFMEWECPSTNDIIATPIGGAAIGEVLYRTADLIIDDRSRGAERFGRELAAFVVNPMRGFTRLVTGRAWERRSTSGRRYGIPPVSVELSLGSRYITMLNGGEGRKAGGALEIDIEYGDRFAPSAKAPYDWFSFLMELNAVKTQPLLGRVEITGRLLSKELLDKPSLKASVGMYQHFDYFDSDTIRRRDENANPLTPCVVPYKLGTPACVGAGAMGRYIPSPGWAIDGHLHLSGMVLAGILTDFYRDHHRNYNWGSGYSIKGVVELRVPGNRFSVTVAEQFYKVFTWTGFDSAYGWATSPGGEPLNIQGDTSRASFNHLEFMAKSVSYTHLTLPTIA